MATERDLKERIAKLANEATQVAYAVRVEYAAGNLASPRSVDLVEKLDGVRELTSAVFTFADNEVLNDWL